MTLKMKNLLSEIKVPEGIVRQFRKDDDGSIIIFSIFMFVLILWFGGMAVDLMRFETTRAKLQGTLDRAVLAAADLDQVIPPADVVRDYFEKADMLQFLDGDPIVDEGINFRVVTANAEAVMPLFFYDLPSVFSSPFSAELSSLTVSGASTAEERVSDVEVSLVLDVSSSMNSNSRITNLRPAAREFVTTVLANNTNAPQGLITISIIPYSAVVNIGTDITNATAAGSTSPLVQVNRTHNHSTCLRFDNSEFLTTALDLTQTYDHIAHFDPGWYGNPSPLNPIKAPWCPLGNENAIVPHTTNEADLHAAITALEPYGNTAIDLGVKWGVALLDPSTKDLVTSLSETAGTGVPAIADGRPEAYTEAEVLKVLVLMTDGRNTTEYELDSFYKTNLSFVWANLDSAAGNLANTPVSETSVQTAGLDTPTYYRDDRFFWNLDGNVRKYPRGFSSRQEYRDARADGAITATDLGEGPTFANNVRRVSWQELYGSAVDDKVNNTYLLDAYNAGEIPWSSSYPEYANYIGPDNAVYSLVNSSQADTRLSNLCEAARDAGIIIYTVAFEAPTEGQTALRDCASSESHYFDVAGTDISAAFSAIASDIRALKLTQ